MSERYCDVVRVKSHSERFQKRLAVETGCKSCSPEISNNHLRPPKSCRSQRPPEVKELLKSGQNYEQRETNAIRLAFKAIITVKEDKIVKGAVDSRKMDQPNMEELMNRIPEKLGETVETLRVSRIDLEHVHGQKSYWKYQ